MGGRVHPWEYVPAPVLPCATRKMDRQKHSLEDHAVVPDRTKEAVPPPSLRIENEGVRKSRNPEAASRSQAKERQPHEKYLEDPLGAVGTKEEVPPLTSK